MAAVIGVRAAMFVGAGGYLAVDVLAGASRRSRQLRELPGGDERGDFGRDVARRLDQKLRLAVPQSARDVVPERAR